MFLQSIWTFIVTLARLYRFFFFKFSAWSTFCFKLISIRHCANNKQHICPSGCLNVTYLDFSQSSRGVNRIVPRWQFRWFVSGTFTITISGGATRSGSGYAVRIFIWDGNARSVANINGGSRVFDCKEKRIIKIVLLDI